MAYSIAMATDKRAERKTLIHVATWTEGETTKAAILGKRTEDSSIEFNADIDTTTDILGINYTDVNKTQPQQSFDPAYIIGGDELMAYLNEQALSNNINGYNGTFDVYIVAAYLTETSGTGSTSTTKYRTMKHKGCSIIPDSIGGDAYVSMPYNVYYSNDITTGYVTAIDKTSLLAISTGFTADSAT